MVLESNLIRVALAGNPNCGKSSLFNSLTGAHQHVGNWPGKTVEKKEGFFQAGSTTLQIVDLPGAYSLNAYSMEEIITRDYLLEEKPDVIISVVDASNLERNLYMTVQLLELGIQVLVVLNMADVAEAHGISIDDTRLSQALHCPIVRTVASQGKGMDRLVDAILQSVRLPEYVS